MLFLELLSKNTTDPKVRLEIGHQLLDVVQTGGLPSDANSLTTFMDVMVQWLNGTNFKVAVLALEILSSGLEVSNGPMVGCLLDNASTIMERLGDSREQVRQFAVELLLKMMGVPGSSPQAVFDRIHDGLSHKQWLVRIGIMVVLRQVLRSYGPAYLQLAKVVPSVCRLLADPMNQVRDVATETLVDMYVCLGDKLALDIQKKQLVPHARAAALFSRFEDVKRSGNADLSLANCNSSNDSTVFLFGSHDSADRAGNYPVSHTSSAFRKPVPVKAPVASPAGSSGGSSSNSKRAASAPPMKRMQTSSRYIAKQGTHKKVTARSSAGAVDENSFVSAFEDVPKVEVYNAKDLVSQLQQIRSVVINPNCDWDKRVDSLKRVRSLLIGGASSYEEFYSELRTLEVPLQLACKDLRSQVVREASITVAFIAEQVGPRFDHFAELILPVLISLIQNSAKVIATSGLVACRFIIRNTRTSRIISVIVDSCTSKSREIRRACYDMIATVCDQWSRHELEKSTSVLQNAIRQGLADADPDARAASRKAYWCFSDHFRDQAEALFQSLDIGKRRNLLGDVTQSSSSHSLYSALRTSQESVKSAVPVYMNACRAPPCVRSTSEIDTGAVRRAAMKQASVSKAPLLSQNISSLPRQPKASVPGFGKYALSPGVNPPRYEVGTVRSPTSTSKSVSQPGSRSSSPTSRSSVGLSPLNHGRFNGSLAGYRSQTNSRDNSPSSKTPRRLGTPDRSGYSIGRHFGDTSKELEFNLGGTPIRGARRGEDFGSESSSLCSDASFRGYDSCDVADVLRRCASSVWSERKEAMLVLQSLFKSVRRLSKPEVKKVCDLFSRLFVDPHHKTFAVFLETLIDFLRAYHSELHEWLYILLCRLLAKQSTELLPSVQNKLLKALDTVRELFPCRLQFEALVRYFADPVQTPNMRMKLNLLSYMNEVLRVMEPSSLTDTSDVRLAVSRVIQWTGEPKSSEIRRASQNALVSMFNLNAPEFSRILNTFSRAYQDTVYRFLNSQKRHLPDIGSLRINNAQSEKANFSTDVEHVHDILKKTSEEIQKYPFSDLAGLGSMDSGIVDVVDNFLRNGSGGNTGVLGSCANDEERQEEVITDILAELSNHNQRSLERKQAMSKLKFISRDGSFTLWDEHFKSVLVILLETLGDNDPEVRAYALPVLKEICTRQPQRIRGYAEVTILKLLDAHKDPERDVARSAEDCATVLATHLPPLVCFRVLIPVMRDNNSPTLLAAIKMTTRVVENMDSDELVKLLPELVPGILMGFENQSESSVRKASVLCLVAIHAKVGSETLEPFLSPLNVSKRKLLNLYIKRDQQQ
uniref:TOG domain-containing protein n=1 Tax=Trichuris muris TaxID=70415 RepID=A0A5S6QS55_TRIMR